MKLPSGPFLEFSFYFSNLTEPSAMSFLVRTLAERNAEFTGIGKAHLGEAIREKPFADITNPILNDVRVQNMDDFDKINKDQNARLIQIYMSNATGANLQTSEIVTFLDISPEASTKDRHPITIWTEGERLSGNYPVEHPTQAKKFGRKIYSCFIELISTLTPMYAAITVEWPLECPFDLKQDPRSLSFIDFYISQTFIGNKGFESIQAEFSNYYQERVSDGIYFSGTKYLNPLGIGLDRDLVDRKSMVVAKMIAGST